MYQKQNRILCAFLIISILFMIGCPGDNDSSQIPGRLDDTKPSDGENDENNNGDSTSGDNDARLNLALITIEKANIDRVVWDWAACPEGYVVTGGGIDINSPGEDNWAQSYPDPYDHATSQWRGGHNDSSGNLFAQCGKIENSASNLECRFIEVYAERGEYVYAECSPDEVVTGGGIQTQSPGGDNVAISWPYNKRIWVGYHNDNEGWVYAVCCQEKTTDYSLDCNIYQEHIDSIGTVECNDDYKATGGGVSIGSPGGDNITLSYPINDYVWEFYNNDGTGSKAHIVCCRAEEITQ